MSTDRATFLAHCLDQPADDITRLAYADFLREQDNPATAAIGRFIWAGVTLSRFRGTEPFTDGEPFQASAELAETAVGVLGGQLKALLGWEWEHMTWDTDPAAPDRITVTVLPKSIRNHKRKRAANCPAAIYERGMLHTLRLSLGYFRDVADGVLASCPLNRFEALDVPGMSLAVAGPEDGWRLIGWLDLPAIRPHSAVRHVASEPLDGTPGLSRENLAGQIETLTVIVVDQLRYLAGSGWPGPANPWYREDDTA